MRWTSSQSELKVMKIRLLDLFSEAYCHTLRGISEYALILKPLLKTDRLPRFRAPREVMLTRRMHRARFDCSIEVVAHVDIRRGRERKESAARLYQGESERERAGERRREKNHF